MRKLAVRGVQQPKLLLTSVLSRFEGCVLLQGVPGWCVPGFPGSCAIPVAFQAKHIRLDFLTRKELEQNSLVNSARAALKLTRLQLLFLLTTLASLL